MSSRPSLLNVRLLATTLCLLTSIGATWRTAVAWQIQTPGTELVLDFESTIPGVISYHAETSYTPAVAEPGEFHLEKESSMRLNSETFSVQNPKQDFGLGQGVATAHGPDMDGNGTTAEAPKSVRAGLVFVRGGSAEGEAAPLPEGNTGLLIGTRRAAPFNTYLNTTLLIKNETGVPLTQWNIALDVWYADADGSSATLEVTYSTDGTTFLPLATLTSTGTVSEGEFQSYNPAHWSAVQKLGGAVAASVPPGGMFYLRLARPEGTGSAADFLIDNLKIQGQ